MQNMITRQALFHTQRLHTTLAHTTDLCSVTQTTNTIVLRQTTSQNAQIYTDEYASKL